MTGNGYVHAGDHGLGEETVGRQGIRVGDRLVVLESDGDRIARGKRQSERRAAA